MFSFFTARRPGLATPRTIFPGEIRAQGDVGGGGRFPRSALIERALGTRFKVLVDAIPKSYFRDYGNFVEAINCIG